MKEFFQNHSQEYLILDFNHLFVSSSLREEIWLLRLKDDAAILSKVLTAAKKFGIRRATADRTLATFSGGEQALLASLLIMAFIEADRLSGLRLLLVNVLESISEANRMKLLRILEDLCAAHGLRIFSAREHRIEELKFPHAN